MLTLIVEKLSFISHTHMVQNKVVIFGSNITIECSIRRCKNCQFPLKQMWSCSTWGQKFSKLETKISIECQSFGFENSQIILNAGIKDKAIGWFIYQNYQHDQIEWQPSVRELIILTPYNNSCHWKLCITVIWLHLIIMNQNTIHS